MATPITNLNLLPSPANNSNHTIKLIQGQTLQINITSIKGEQVQFNLAGQSFSANNKTLLSETGQIKVTVLQVIPSLQLGISPEKTSTQQAQQAQQLIQDALRQLLPNQTPIAQALQQLTQPGIIALLPPSIQAQLNSLLEHYFKLSANTSAKDIKSHLQNSGLFFENGIKKDNKPSPQDLKGKLLQLNQQMTSLAQNEATTNKLSAILGQAINKITLQQVQLFETPNILSVQLPIQQENSIKKLQIDFRKRSYQDSSFTEVILNICSAEGEMIYKLSLNNKELSIYIWADNKSLELQIYKEITSLRQQLSDSGLILKNLLLSQNKPQILLQTKQTSLIDLHI